MYQSMVTVTLRSLFVPRRYFVPARTFLGVPYRLHERSRPFYDQKSSETVRDAGRSLTLAGTVNGLKRLQNHVSKTKEIL